MSTSAEDPLLGRLAVMRELIDAEQLATGLAEQARSKAPLGDVLVEQGLIDAAQRDQLRGELLDLFDGDSLEYRRRYQDDYLLGRLIVNWELASRGQVREAIQARLAQVAEGVDEPLGEVLVRLGYLTPYQVHELLGQRTQSLGCPACDRRYKVLGYEEGFRLRCLSCPGELKPVAARKGEAPQTLFFDREHAERVSVLGRTAQKLGLCSREQLARAVTLQSRGRVDDDLGDLLVETGAIDAEQLGQLRQQLERFEKKRQATTRHKFKDHNLGQIALARGFISKPMLNLTLQEQAALAIQGAPPRLGEMLVEASFLTSYQLMRLLTLQSKTLVVCRGCGAQFNVLNLEEGEQARCPECQHPLETSDALESVSVETTISPSLEQLAAITPDEPPPAEGYHDQLLLLRDKAVRDLSRPRDSTSVITNPLDQTRSLQSFASDTPDTLYRKSIDEASLTDWVGQCTERQPLWKVMAIGGRWFCPYCGVAAVRISAPTERVAEITDHLARRCQVFRQIGMVPVFPVKELRRRAMYLMIKEKTLRDPAWQVRDKQRRWTCPYCARITKIRLESDRIDRDAFEAIARHVLECQAFNARHPERHQPVELLVKNVVKHTVLERLTADLRQLMESEPVWTVRDAEGAWICPYCRKGQPQVKAASPIDLRLNAPPQAAQHLLAGCPPFFKRQPPSPSAEALLAEASGQPLPAPPATAARQPALDAVAEMGQLERELSSQMAEMQADLDRARNRQQAMLPDNPRMPGLEIETFYRPCDELAGDFYDFIRLGPDRLGVVIGDVSGHGVNAALVMGMCKKALSLVARQTDSPARSLTLANEEFHRDLDGQTFVSLWYGVFDLTLGTLRQVRSGHQPPLLYNARREPRLQSIITRGMAAGICSGRAYERTLEETVIALEPGDLLVLSTDGITEVRNSAGDLWGDEAFEEAVRITGVDGPVGVIKAIMRQAETHAAGEPFEDDMTLIALRFTGPQKPPTNPWGIPIAE